MNHAPISCAAAALSLALLGVGCDRFAAARPPKKVDAGARRAAEPASPKKAVLARIAFLDVQDACECTKARIDASWQALQAALKERPGTTVERIHIDTQEALAKPYTVERALMVPPGVYFVGPAGEVLELLQGELTDDQIRLVLAQHAR